MYTQHKRVTLKYLKTLMIRLHNYNSFVKTPFDIVYTNDVTIDALQQLLRYFDLTHGSVEIPDAEHLRQNMRTRRINAANQTHLRDPIVLTTNYWREPREYRHSNYLSAMPREMMAEITSYLGGRRKRRRTRKRRTQK